MQITKFSDLALRTLIQLAVTREDRHSAKEIAARHGVSFNHVAKVAQWLSSEGYIQATRGRAGGIVLAKKAEEISIGRLLRKTEAGTALVECLREDGGACFLSPACGLLPYLQDAKEAFFQTLDDVTLADVIGRNKRMAKLVRSLHAVSAGD